MGVGTRQRHCSHTRASLAQCCEEAWAEQDQDEGTEESVCSARRPRDAARRAPWSLKEGRSELGAVMCAPSSGSPHG
jgi:hypothetical protein